MTSATVVQRRLESSGRDTRHPSSYSPSAYTYLHGVAQNLGLLILLTASFLAGIETFNYYPPNWYAALKRPEWLQFIVAIVGIGVIAWQAWLTRKAVEAAEIGAKAARDNVELLISKDRARIEIIAGGIPVVGNAVIGSLCYLNNVGPSIATIEEGGVALVEAGREIEVDYARCIKIPIVGNIPANSRSSGQFLIPLQPEIIITEARALDIRQAKAFVHCFGYVTYRDVFGRRHRVQLHLRWFMRWGGMLQGQVMEWWEPVGKPEENSDTEIRTLPEINFFLNCREQNGLLHGRTPGGVQRTGRNAVYTLDLDDLSRELSPPSSSSPPSSLTC